MGIKELILKEIAKHGLKKYLKETPISQAISETNKIFIDKGIPLGYALWRWCESTAFLELLKDFKGGEREFVNEGVVKSFIEIGASDDGQSETITTDTAKKILSVFFKKLEETFYKSGDLLLHAKRDEALHDRTYRGIREIADSIKNDKKLLERAVDGKLPPSLHNQTPPEPNFVGRQAELEEITKWYKDPDVRIGALIAWGGEGKSTIARRWFDLLNDNGIAPDGVFWWGFYRNADLNRFIASLYKYLGGDPSSTQSTWVKVDGIKDMLQRCEYLIVLDGLEEMQGNTRGNEFGRMIHPEFDELLKGIADSRSRGLCLIASRIPPKGLEPYKNNGFEVRRVSGLEPDAARELLRKKGIAASDEDMNLLIENLRGHALSISSVGEYVRRYCEGRVACVLDLKYVINDEDQRFDDIKHLFSRYEKSMTEAERAFLMLFSLFRTSVTGREFYGFFRKKISKSRLNRKLCNISRADFIDLVEGLVKWGLIEYGESTKAYSAHPLIKKYFESLFEDEDRKTYHKEIFEHINSYAPAMPDTLDEMRPLFEMVYHGTRAEMYDESLYDVYVGRIQRRDEAYLIHKLGACETNLGLVRNFFPDGDLSKTPMVISRSSQGYLINEAGLVLKNTGRPLAAEMFKKNISLDVKGERWENASVGYQNLAGLQFRTGKINEAGESATEALRYSEKAENKQSQCDSKTYLAYITFLLGRMEEAGRMFEEVHMLQREISGYGLYSQRGLWYSDFLLLAGKADKALEVKKKNLEICTRYGWPDDISRCHRSLGMIMRFKGKHNAAFTHLETALEIARKIGVPDIEAEALTERGRVYLEIEKYKEAEADLNAVLKIVERTSFKLYAPDAEITLAKVVFKKTGDKKEARRFAETALNKAKSMSYHWPQKEAEEFLKDC